MGPRQVSPGSARCRVAALGLASGIVLVLLLLCLYRVLCPRNYGQPGAGPGRRRRGELPCDDYGYAPPETEIVPLVLRGHLMVSVDGAGAGGAGNRAAPQPVPMCMPRSRPCSPRDSQESSPTPQFKSINSLALSLLHRWF